MSFSSSQITNCQDADEDKIIGYTLYGMNMIKSPTSLTL